MYSCLCRSISTWRAKPSTHERRHSIKATRSAWALAMTSVPITRTAKEAPETQGSLSGCDWQQVYCSVLLCDRILAALTRFRELCRAFWVCMASLRLCSCNRGLLLAIDADWLVAVSVVVTST